MKNLYLVTPNDDSAEQLLHMFWEFHDFRISRVEYSTKDDRVEVNFEYDDNELRLMLRFEGEAELHINPTDYEADWISGAALFPDDGKIKWMNCEMSEVPFSTDKSCITYFKGDRLIWAVVDKNGKTLPLDDEYLHQDLMVWESGETDCVVKHCDFTVIPFKY